MFAWWLVKRAWKRMLKAVMDKVEQGARDDCVSIREEIYYIGVFMGWLAIFALSGIASALNNAEWHGWLLWLLSLPLVPVILAIPKLHTQYRTENPPSEKPKRKRKPDYRKARGCLEELFESDPRSSEQIIRDYREGDEYSEPQPRDYDILDYLDARLKWHDRDDRDESEGE